MFIKWVFSRAEVIGDLVNDKWIGENDSLIGVGLRKWEKRF